MSEEVKIDQLQFRKLNDNLDDINRQLRSIWFLGFVFGLASLFHLFYISRILRDDIPNWLM